MKTTTVEVLRVDGSVERHEVPRAIVMRTVREKIGADTLDAVDLGRGRVMLVDDEGWDYVVEQVAPGHIRHVPTTPRRPLNAQATALYLQRCKAGTTHQIAGDVAVVVDREIEG